MSNTLHVARILTDVIESNRNFIVTLGFFDDVQIPASYLQHPSKFNEDEQLWIWEYEAGGQKHQLYMDIGEYQGHLISILPQIFQILRTVR